MLKRSPLRLDAKSQAMKVFAWTSLGLQLLIIFLATILISQLIILLICNVYFLKTIPEENVNNNA